MIIAVYKTINSVFFSFFFFSYKEISIIFEKSSKIKIVKTFQSMVVFTCLCTLLNYLYINNYCIYLIYMQRHY